MKHLYMFVIDAGVVALHKYGIGGAIKTVEAEVDLVRMEELAK